MEPGRVDIHFTDRSHRPAGRWPHSCSLKSGEANANRWYGERPEEPQMLLYATALERPPGAVSFALLNAEGCSFD